jgi:ferric-dicitrate binding protein FerR (iron transport regulator)
MNAIIHDQPPQLDRVATAGEWLQRLHDRPPDHGTWSEWQRWQSDPNNRAAFEKLLRVWRAFDHPILRHSLRASIDTPVTQPHPDRTPQWLPRTVAFLLAFLCNALLTSILFMTPPAPAEHVYATDKGGFGRFTLPGGTLLEVNTDSRVRLQRSTEGTTARLERGEAFFQSAPNTRSPIQVIAGNTLLAHITGAAAIRLRDDSSVEITVQAGTVALSEIAQPKDRPAMAQLPSIILKLSQTATIQDHQASIHSIDPHALECRLAWRTRTICSDGGTVASIVHELNRYNHTRVVIVDPTVGMLRVGGRFSATRPSDFIELIDQVFPARIIARPTPEDEIHLLAQK